MSEQDEEELEEGGNSSSGWEDGSGVGFTVYSRRDEFLGKYYIMRFYLPDEPHETRGMFPTNASPHDNDMTMADLGHALFKGKWAGWFASLKSDIASRSDVIEKIIKNTQTEEMKQLRRRYMGKARAMRRANTIVQKSDGTYELTSRGLTKSGSVFYDLFNFIGRGKNRVGIKTFKYKKEAEALYRLMRDEAWAKEEGIRSMILSYSGKEIADGLMMQDFITNPARWAFGAKQAVSAQASKILPIIREMIHAKKSPDIEDRTKQNRARRKYGHCYLVENVVVKSYTRKGKTVSGYTYSTGHTKTDWEGEGPPLYETGILANSVKYEVIIE